MIGVAAVAAAHQPGIDGGTPLQGMGFRFQHQSTAAFSNDKAVPQSVKWPAGVCRIVVVSGKGFGVGQAVYHQGAEHRFRPYRQHHFCPP